MKKISNFIKKYKLCFLLFGLLLVFIIIFWKIIYPNIRNNQLNDITWLDNHISLVQDESIGSNVFVVSKDDDIDIFTENYQKVIREKIEEKLTSNDYTFDNPLIILNPYGTNNNAINLYFRAEEDCQLSYIVQTDDTPDYTQTLKSQSGPNYEFQIIGLVNDKKNTLEISLIKEKQTLEQRRLTINLPASTSNIETTLKTTDGASTSKLTDGLYTVLGHDKNFNSNIYLYDNNGVMRSELALKSYRTDRIVFAANSMIYSYKNNGFIKVNSQGQITDFYTLKGYTMHHDFIYDEKNNSLVILVNKNGEDTIEDFVISLDLKTKEITELLDLKDYLRDYYNTAVEPANGNTYGGDELDWIHLNSLQVIDGQDILLSSRELSMIIRINDIYTDPVLDYILADESVIADSIYQDYAYSKIGDFVSHAGQHTVTYSRDDNLTDSQYYVTIYNNNYAGARTRPNFDWSNYQGAGTYDEGSASMYYKYLVDDQAKTYTLVKSFELPYSSIVSSIQDIGSNHVTSSGKAHVFGEYDHDGQLIKSYNYTSKKYAYRVFKYDFKDIWFA